MANNSRTTRFISLLALGMIMLIVGCGGNQAAPTATPTEVPAAAAYLPTITDVQLDRSEVPCYESLEMTIELRAVYTNPYDTREVSLEGVFAGPDGTQIKVPGYWDGEGTWQVRFTPSQEGEWHYQLVVREARGASLPYEGRFTVTASDLHGWLQAGNWVNPDYSGHYLVYKDGTPFYGVGHDDALNVLVSGFSADSGVGLFNEMKQAGENYVVWWPLYSNPLLSSSYADYTVANMKVIDMVVADAQKKGIFLVFTIWDHPELRDNSHPWGNGNWGRNGFNQLGDINSFFASDEAWAWQENFYRYIYCPLGLQPGHRHVADRLGD